MKLPHRHHPRANIARYCWHRLFCGSCRRYYSLAGIADMVLDPEHRSVIYSDGHIYIWDEP